MSSRLCRGLLALFLVSACGASLASAQVHAVLVADGFDHPVAFVQDPSDPTVQVVVELAGRVRLLRNGVVQPDYFLDINDQVLSGGELGMLGLAFAPDYGTSGRVYVYFINLDGNSVVRRFVRAGDEPLRLDPDSGFDLWFNDQQFVYQPYPNHKGGNMAFGPDGYLYIGLGDGGAGNDPLNQAQDPTSFLGKILRLDVSVPDVDPEGFDIPPDNPFANSEGVLPHIWALGLRNPWRWSFDDPLKGGTGALVIADVGQDAWEEIDYQPAGVGGRNYGWRVREGTHPIFEEDPWSGITDPIHEYSHDDGRSITGGVVYRGSALDASYRGRYFFTDFIDGRLWSMGLTIDPGTGEASKSDLLEHTSTVGDASRFVSSFGVDADGELYVLSYGAGRLYRLGPGEIGGGVSNLASELESPAGLNQPTAFAVRGWAIDLGASANAGVDAVHIWAVPAGGSPMFLGAASRLDRPDVAALYGPQFLASGFDFAVAELAAGSYTIQVYVHSTVNDSVVLVEQASIVVQGAGASQPHMAIDSSTPGYGGATVTIAGWAVDTGAASGTGVTAVEVWATRTGVAPRFLGLATYGLSRPDVGTTYGAQFTNSGFQLKVAGLPPGAWDIVAYLNSAILGSHALSTSLPITLADGLQIRVELPSHNQQLWPGRRYLSGWAYDLGAAANAGSGVSAVDVWAVPQNGAAWIWVGQVLPVSPRPDIAGVLGSQFLGSGFTMFYDLPPGDYALLAFAYRTSTLTFDAMDVVPVSILGGGLRVRIEVPSHMGQAPAGLNFVSGWTYDVTATSGVGVSAIHIWAVPRAGGSPVFLGPATLSPRTDIAAVLGSQFLDSGFYLYYNLPPGDYDLTAYALRTSTGAWEASDTVRVTINGG